MQQCNTLHCNELQHITNNTTYRRFSAGTIAESDIDNEDCILATRLLVVGETNPFDNDIVVAKRAAHATCFQ